MRRDTTLVVVPDFAEQSTADQDGVLEAWQLIFDEMYADEPGDRLAGWVDSTTGEPVGPQDMKNWVQATVERITPLPHGRVLEIGSGTGLIARSVLALEDVERYVATDVSESAVQNLRNVLPMSGVVEYRVGDALGITHELNETFDLVVLNSVCQYFPSTRYLTEVLAHLAPRMAPGGHVVLGDLRHAGLEPRLAAERARLHRPDADPAELDRVAQDILHNVTELALHPGWCERLAQRIPGVTAVDTSPRLGTAATEMTRFRFDAVLHFGCPTVPAPTATARDAAALDGPALDERIRLGVGPFRFIGVPNARLVTAPHAVDPGVLRRAAAESRGTLAVRFADDSSEGTFDIAWSPESCSRRCGWTLPRLHACDAITPALPPRATQRLTAVLTQALHEGLGALDPALEILVTDETPAEWRS
ncbi:class I SAM-dependent methyltransferase [Streptomyces sp. NPDC018045]|uniref:class I SAM-dependent methyltransferase n=1 Tax=Streptomyces sp. NPDC018045 TaxID=3365037 RepID=UPI003794780E